MRTWNKVFNCNSSQTPDCAHLLFIFTVMGEVCTKPSNPDQSALEDDQPTQNLSLVEKIKKVFKLLFRVKSRLTICRL